ncbi:hypothetical protein [Aquisphaera insulae]|uniref:hypothetical protein n=1 Tax=Aquisphaera insulae TaxID=2712864 RepID=UPI0013ECA007|nr:hypothetical protein [Aquisphaera insulae]
MRNPFRRFFRKPVGFPLGQHVPADPAEHAADFSLRNAAQLDWLAAIHLEALGIPSDRIGSNDHDHGLRDAAFNPYERDGGGVSQAGQINLDAGSFNPEHVTARYGTRAGKVWARARLRDRWDALIAHEDMEWRRGGDHDAAVLDAPETDLPISDGAREILRAMRKGARDG